MGIAMFLAGGMSRGGQDATAAGNSGAATSYGIAAASFVFIFTSIFGATWLTVPWLVCSINCVLSARILMMCSIQRRYSHLKFAQRVTPGE